MLCCGLLCCVVLSVVVLGLDVVQVVSESKKISFQDSPVSESKSSSDPPPLCPGLSQGSGGDLVRPGVGDAFRLVLRDVVRWGAAVGVGAAVVHGAVAGVQVRYGSVVSPLRHRQLHLQLRNVTCVPLALFDQLCQCAMFPRAMRQCSANARCTSGMGRAAAVVDPGVRAVVRKVVQQLYRQWTENGNTRQLYVSAVVQAVVEMVEGWTGLQMGGGMQPCTPPPQLKARPPLHYFHNATAWATANTYNCRVLP